MKSFESFLCPCLCLEVLECTRGSASVCVRGNLWPWQVYPVKQTGIAGPLLLLLSERGEADGGLCWPDKRNEDSAVREREREREKEMAQGEWSAV